MQPSPGTHSRTEELRRLARLCLRLLVFLTLVWGLQWELTRLAHLDRPSAFSPSLVALDRVRDDDVVYMGDSVLTNRGSKDKDLRLLPEMLATRLAPARLTAIAHPAFQPRFFEGVTSYLLRTGVRPRLLLVPINLRAFSPLWTECLSYQFSKEMALLGMGPGPGAALMRFRLAFKELPAPPPDLGPELLWSRAGFRALRARYPALVAESPLGRYPGKTDFVRMYYLTELGPQHPYLRALARLAENAHRARVPVVFYVTPIDIESATEYLGPPFRAEVAAKVERFRATLSATGADFVDLSTAVAPADFMWREEGAINEHLSERGRVQVSRTLARHLRPRLAGQEQTPTPAEAPRARVARQS